MGSVVVVVILIVLIGYIVAMIRSRRRGVVAERGIGVGADLGGLADAPRVRVRDVRLAGPDRAEVVLAPEDGGEAGDDQRFVVWLRRDEFGYGLLTDWQRDREPIAIVLPPGGRLIRLRSTVSLQHLTLRRIDGDGDGD